MTRALYKNCWDTSIERSKARKIAAKYHWHGLYNFSLLELVSCALYCLEWEKVLVEAKDAEHPRVLLEAAGNSLRELKGDNRIVRQGLDELAVAVTFIALALSLKSLALYGYSIHGLLVKGEQEKDDAALLKAVRIDQSVILSNQLNARIRTAVLNQDTKFLNKLGDAIKGKIGKASRQYAPARITILMLHEAQQLKSMLRGKEGRQFILQKLGLYSAEDDHWPAFNRFISRVLSGELRQ